jgi:hypothetical protein
MQGTPVVLQLLARGRSGFPRKPGYPLTQPIQNEWHVLVDGQM